MVNGWRGYVNVIASPQISLGSEERNSCTITPHNGSITDSNTASPAILQLLIARLSFVLSFCVLPSFLPVALCACFFLPFFDLPFRSDITIMVDRALNRLSIFSTTKNKKSIFSFLPTSVFFFVFFFGGGGGRGEGLF